MYSTARRLADFEHDDLPVEHNIIAAIELFQRCIDEQNHVAAMFDLARILEGDEYTCDDTDLLHSVALYERCIVESNSTEPKLSLARLLQHRPRNIPADFVRAVELYESCIEQTATTTAMFELAGILADGVPGIEKDVSRALQLYDSCIGGGDNAFDAISKVVKIIVARANSAEKHLIRALEMVQAYFEASSDPTDLLNHVCRVVSQQRHRLDASTNTPYVKRLLEMCIEKCNDTDAMFILADILLLDTSQITSDLNRGLHLCAAALEQEDDWSARRITSIAREIVDRQWRTSQTVSAAVELCEMCIEMRNDTEAMLILAEILMSAGVTLENNVDRAMDLCMKFLLGDGFCEHLALFAKKVADGRSGVTRDVKLAMELCEKCIHQQNDPTAMMVLAGIYITGAPGIEKDIDRAIDLCDKCLSIEHNESVSSFDVTDLIWKLVQGTPDKTADVDLALQLSEMYIEKRNDTGATLMLAELLLTGAWGVEKDVNRGMGVCQKYMDAEGSCYWVNELARNLVDGAYGITRDAPLAIKLCEMCINISNDIDALLILIEILMGGTPGVEQDDDRVLELCEKYLTYNRRCEALTNLAQIAVHGTWGRRKDARLAMQICEMCIEKKNDAGAMIILGEILMSGAANVEKDVDRAVQLWKASFNGDIAFHRLASVLREMVFGIGHIPRNVPLAIELCESVIASRDDYRAVATLAEIHTCSTDDVADIDRGLELWGKCLDDSGGHFGMFRSAANLARKIVRGSCGMERNIELAVQLCEMCMASWDEWKISEYVLVTVAEVLICAARHVEDAERAVHLCKVAMDMCDEDFKKVAEVARDAAFGTDWMKRDTALAIRLCNMSIEKKRDAHAFMTLAEIFITGTPEVEKNISYAMELCEQSVTEHRHENLVPCLAKNVASGTERMEGDAALGVKLCEICVDKRRDVRAMAVLSEIYAMGGWGVKMDMGRAHEWYERAAVEGWLLFQYRWEHGIEYTHQI